jgi:hypothetical protein
MEAIRHITVNGVQKDISDFELSYFLYRNVYRTLAAHINQVDAIAVNTIVVAAVLSYVYDDVDEAYLQGSKLEQLAKLDNLKLLTERRK